MKDILLVFGGKSYEHDISVVTASQIFSKTKLKDIKLIPLYVSRENLLYVYSSDKFDLKDFSKSSFSPKNKKFKEVAFVSGEENKLFIKTRIGLKEYLSVEYAVFACHGQVGENGKLISLFELMGIKTSAGNFDSLAVCMNKFLFKQAMKGLRIPTLSGFKIVKSVYENDKDTYASKLRFLHFPVIMKAVSGGSSIGVFVVKSKEEFDEKLKEVFEFDSEVLIEKYLPNSREFNVAVLGTIDDYEVSEIDEPLKEHEVLSFSDKYMSGGEKSVKIDKSLKNSMASSLRKFPADISHQLKEKIQSYAGKIFEGLNLCGVVRIDFLYDEQNDRLYVCEVNSIPGSLSYYFFPKNRVLVNDLVIKLIDCAERNSNNKSLFNEEFSTSVLD